MCSEACTDTSNIQFQETRDWQISAPESDEEEPIEFGRGRCRSLPNDVREAEKTTAFHKLNTERTSRRNRGYSLEDRVIDWHRSLVKDIKGEREAKKYTELVKDDTLKHLRNSIVVAGSMVGKGADINKELYRHERILRKADTEMSIAEYHTEQTTLALKGMTSLTGKLTSNLRKPKLNLKFYDDFELLNGEMGLCSLTRGWSGLSTPQYKCSLKDTKERRIKEGMGELRTALDVVKIQQLDAAWTLYQQKDHLSMFEKKLDRTHTKINNQKPRLKCINNTF